MPTNKEWTTEERKLGLDQFKVGKGMIESEDFFDGLKFDSFNNFRDHFKNSRGYPCTLTDDQIITLVMSTNDEEDEDWFLDRVVSAQNFFGTTEGANALAEVTAVDV